MQVCSLHLVNLALLALGEVLVLLFKVLHDLGVVNLLGASLVHLLLSHLFDLQHNLVQPVLVDKRKPQALTLVEQEVHVYVAEDFLLESVNQMLLDLFRQLFLGVWVSFSSAFFG